MKAELNKAMKPTHWMDERGFVVTDEFLRGPRSTSDWRMAYCIPCIKKGRKMIIIDGTNLGPPHEQA